MRGNKTHHVKPVLSKYLFSQEMPTYFPFRKQPHNKPLHFVKVLNIKNMRKRNMILNV